MRRFISNNWGIMLWLLLTYVMYTTWGTALCMMLFPFWMIAPACKN